MAQCHALAPLGAAALNTPGSAGTTQKKWRREGRRGSDGGATHFGPACTVVPSVRRARKRSGGWPRQWPRCRRWTTMTTTTGGCCSAREEPTWQTAIPSADTPHRNCRRRTTSQKSLSGRQGEDHHRARQALLAKRRTTGPF